MDTDPEPVPEATAVVCPTCRGSGFGFSVAPGPRCDGPPPCRTCGEGDDE